MRRYMKYVAAGLFVAALLVVLFLPLLDISVVEFSLLDVMKLGSGLGDADILSGFGTMLEEYMKPYFFLHRPVMLLLLAGAAACVFLPWKQAYPAALLGVGIVNVVMVISVGTLYAKTKELREGLSFFGIEDLVGIHGLTVLLWLVLCAGIAGIGVWGTVQALRGPKTEEMRDILPETFARRGNPWEDRQDLTARADHENRQTKGGEDFGGALRGLQGIYRKKVYPMQDRVPIYLAWDGGTVLRLRRAGRRDPGRSLLCKRVRRILCYTQRKRGMLPGERAASWSRQTLLSEAGDEALPERGCAAV